MRTVLIRLAVVLATVAMMAVGFPAVSGAQDGPPVDVQDWWSSPAPFFEPARGELGAGTALADVASQESAAPAIVINNHNRASVLDAYEYYVAARESITPQWTGSINGCQAGTISDQYVDGAVDMVNFFREFAGNLRPVVHDPAKASDSQRAALIMRANNRLDHYPPPTWTCWSEAGSSGAATSSLSLGRPDLRVITNGYMFDPGSNNAPVGHRRGILDPDVVAVGVGATDRTNALGKVTSSVRPSRQVVTWPPMGYFPDPLLPSRWSVSLPLPFWTAVDWSGARVAMTVNGTAIEHTDQWGWVGPTLVFNPNLWHLTSTSADRVVQVTVSGFTIDGQSAEVSWTTTVMARGSVSSTPDPVVEGAFPTVLSGYTPIGPNRLYDSRPLTIPWEAQETRLVEVRGRAGVPATATAVALHVTSVNPTEDSFVTAWASGGSRPLAASKNFGPGEAYVEITNDLVIVPIGADGRIAIYNHAGTTDLVIDVAGYFGPGGGGYIALEPTRLYDSRPLTIPWEAQETRLVEVRGRAGVPVTATAVALHVTSVNPTEDSFVTAWASGGSRPLAASKNFGPGEAYVEITNDLVIVPIGADGRIAIYNHAGTTDLVIDVAGYFGPGGGGYIALEPTRLYDSRPTNFPWGPQEISWRFGLDDRAPSAVVLHVTSVDPSEDTYITAWGGGQRPLAASKNFGIGDQYAQITNDLLIVPSNSGGGMAIFNNAGWTHLVIDVVGYFTG